MKERSRSDKNSSKELKEFLFWEALSTEIVADCEIFLVHETLAASKCEKKMKSRFHTIKCRPWVNIIALTDDLQVVMAEQYRHGIRDLTLEIPGGCIDESDPDPRSAARRELLEESGYVSERWTALGKIHHNPAMQDNFCYTFLAEGVKKLEEPRFDGSGTERIHSSLIYLSEIDELIRNGTITHSLVVTAFHFLLLEKPELLKRSKSST